MVYIFLAEGFEAIETITPLDMLIRAGVEVNTISISDEFVVRAIPQTGCTLDAKPQNNLLGKKPPRSQCHKNSKGTPSGFEGVSLLFLGKILS